MLGAALASKAQEVWTLDKCIEHAIENNISIRRQQNTIERDEISLNTAKMNVLPDLSANVRQGWDFGRGLTMENTYVNKNTSNTSFSLSTSVTLFSGLQKYNTIQARKLDLEAATADLDKAKEDLSINVTSSYLQVLYSNELLNVAKRQVELSKAMLNQKEQMAKNGKASESDVAEAKSRVAQDQLSVIQSENEYKLALLDLSQLLELDSPEKFAIEAPDTTAQLMAIPTVEAVYADALNNKAIIKGDNARIEGAEKNVSIAKGGYCPSLYLNAGVSTGYYTTKGVKNASFSDQLNDHIDKQISLSLNIPIFNRFATRNDVRSAKNQVVGMQLQLDADKKALYKEVQQAYYNAIAAESKYGSSLTAEESAELSFRLMNKKYNNGKATQTEYNQSRTEWMKAVADRIQAKYEYIFRAKILEFYRGQA